MYHCHNQWQLCCCMIQPVLTFESHDNAKYLAVWQPGCFWHNNILNQNSNCVDTVPYECPWRPCTESCHSLVMILVPHRQSHFGCGKRMFWRQISISCFYFKRKANIAASPNFFMIHTMNLVRLCHKQAPAPPMEISMKAPGMEKERLGATGLHVLLSSWFISSKL